VTPGTDRRGYLLALGLLALGALLLLLGYGRTWSTSVVDDPGLPTVTVELSGRDLQPAGAAAAVLALAGIAGLVATRRVGRLVTGAVLLLAGLGSGALALIFGLTWSRVPGAGDWIDALVSERIGVDLAGAPTTVTPWWVVALVGGLLVALAGVLALTRSRGWPEMGGRYERAADPAATGPVGAGASGTGSAWDRLDRGEDPTVDASRDPLLGPGHDA
jgi:uncharacterized membrane protein (TIGR02234 family)